MSQSDDDLVVKVHREEVERHRAQKQRQRAQVEAMFDQAAERQRQQDARDQALVERIHREAIEHYRAQGAPPLDRPKGVHYTELSEAEPGEPLAEEWNTYRREVGRWLAEGQEGRHVLIKGREVIGFFEAHDAAYEEGVKRFLGEEFFVHAVRTEEPYLRIRGINYPWPGSPSW